MCITIKFQLAVFLIATFSVFFIRSKKERRENACRSGEREVHSWTANHFFTLEQRAPQGRRQRRQKVPMTVNIATLSSNSKKRTRKKQNKGKTKEARRKRSDTIDSREKPGQKVSWFRSRTPSWNLSKTHRSFTKESKHKNFGILFFLLSCCRRVLFSLSFIWFLLGYRFLL